MPQINKQIKLKAMGSILELLILSPNTHMTGLSGGKWTNF